jgi:hypothetical protein
MEERFRSEAITTVVDREDGSGVLVFMNRVGVDGFGSMS